MRGAALAVLKVDLVGLLLCSDKSELRRMWRGQRALIKTLPSLLVPQRLALQHMKHWGERPQLFYPAVLMKAHHRFLGGLPETGVERERERC